MWGHPAYAKPTITICMYITILYTWNGTKSYDSLLKNISKTTNMSDKVAEKMYVF